MLRQRQAGQAAKTEAPAPRPAAQALDRAKGSHWIMGSAVLLVSAAVLLQTSYQTQAQTARIVGLGATTCRGFNEDVKSNSAIRRDHLA